jgi:lipoprotein-anchoring transpeptidase ErfK/SrfK
LSLSQRQVRILQDNLVLKQYPVAVGKPGWETPVGTFEIKSMVVDPAWKHPFDGHIIPSGDPENPLGRRWIGFWTDGKNWVGFHGTSAAMRSSIGNAASHGCVRMLDEDIQAMFQLVAIGIPVVVTP